MKLTAFDKPISSENWHRHPEESDHTRRTTDTRDWQRYSKGHVRMFRQLRDEGYSWRQIALICGTPPYSPKNAVTAADNGAYYPDVTLTVLECRRSRAGDPAGRAA